MADIKKTNAIAAALNYPIAMADIEVTNAVAAAPCVIATTINIMFIIIIKLTGTIILVV